MRGGAFDLYKRLRLGILSIIVLVLAGVVGFHVIEDWTWMDSLWMTLITLTTVGYGETHPLSATGRIFTMFLLMFGFIAVGATLALLTESLLAFEMGTFFSRRRMEKEIAKMRNHYIICGAGRVGRSVANEFLHYAVPFVIVEKDQAQTQWATEAGIPVVFGTGATEETLRQARIEHAAGLISAVTSDADNLYIVLTAKELRPDLKIIARVSEEEAIPKLKRAGATEVLSPYRGVGRRIAQLMLRPHALDFFDAVVFGKDRQLQVEQFAITPTSRLNGKALAQCELHKSGAILLALKSASGPLTFNPGPGTVVRAGDYLIAIGLKEHLDQLARLAES